MIRKQFYTTRPSRRMPRLRIFHALRSSSITGLLILAFSGSLVGQEINIEGWPVPDLQGLSPYSISVGTTDGVEKTVERFYLPDGSHVARISGNGKVFAYVVDHDQEAPIDYLLLDADGSGRFTLKLGPNATYLIPEWVSQ